MAKNPRRIKSDRSGRSAASRRSEQRIAERREEVEEPRLLRHMDQRGVTKTLKRAGKTLKVRGEAPRTGDQDRGSLAKNDALPRRDQGGKIGGRGRAAYKGGGRKKGG